MQTASTGTSLWALWNGDQRLRATLVDVEEWSRVQLYAEDVLIMWYSCSTRDTAVSAAEEIHDGLIDDYKWSPDRRGMTRLHEPGA